MQNDAPQPVIALSGVTKSFGKNKAVDNITIEIQKGEIFGFLGPNGAGKSTTIRLLLDILRPDKGSIDILGIDNRNTAELHQHIGYLSGDMVLDNDLTGKQYLDFLNYLHGGGYIESIQLLSEKLEANLDKKIGNYSRGNRQKIGLIAALFHDPKLLILDEPTSGFDPLVQEKFAELMREYIEDGGTVFMSSHILGEVQHLCDRVAFIRNGQIVTTTTVSKLVDNNARQIELTAEAREINKISKDYSSIKGLELISRTSRNISFSYSGPVTLLLKYLAAKMLTDVTIREPELEEIFGHYYVTEKTKDGASDA